MIYAEPVKIPPFAEGHPNLRVEYLSHAGKTYRVHVWKNGSRDVFDPDDWFVGSKTLTNGTILASRNLPGGETLADLEAILAKVAS